MGKATIRINKQSILNYLSDRYEIENIELQTKGKLKFENELPTQKSLELLNIYLTQYAYAQGYDQGKH